MTAIKGWGPKSRSSSLIVLVGVLVGGALKSSVPSLNMRGNEFGTEQLGQLPHHFAGRIMAFGLPGKQRPLRDSDAFCQVDLGKAELFPRGPDAVTNQRTRRRPSVSILPKAAKIEL